MPVSPVNIYTSDNLPVGFRHPMLGVRVTLPSLPCWQAHRNEDPLVLHTEPVECSSILVAFCCTNIKLFALTSAFESRSGSKTPATPLCVILGNAGACWRMSSVSQRFHCSNNHLLCLLLLLFKRKSAPCAFWRRDSSVNSQAWAQWGAQVAMTANKREYTFWLTFQS